MEEMSLSRKFSSEAASPLAASASCFNSLSWFRALSLSSAWSIITARFSKRSESPLRSTPEESPWTMVSLSLSRTAFTEMDPFSGRAASALLRTEFRLASTSSLSRAMAMAASRSEERSLSRLTSKPASSPFPMAELKLFRRVNRVLRCGSDKFSFTLPRMV